MSITPSVVTFNNNFGDSFFFELRNKTEEDLYAIGVKMVIEPSTMSADDFEFDVPEKSRRFVGPLGWQLGDITSLHCREKSGKPYIYVGLYHLTPEETRDIIITRTKLGVTSIRAKLRTTSTKAEALGIAGVRTTVPFGYKDVLPELRRDCSTTTIISPQRIYHETIDWSQATSER